MPSSDLLELKGTSSSVFLHPSAKKMPGSRPVLTPRRSNATLSASTPLARVADEDAVNGRHHSLAHELAVALMPEPSTGSTLLAEEFGIEYDEGAEGIDEDNNRRATSDSVPSFSGEQGLQSFASEIPPSFDAPSSEDDLPSEHQSHRPERTKQLEPDAMDVLAQNLKSTDKFLSHLRRLDVDSAPSATQPTLEKIASDVIRRINDTTRDREEQVRALLGYEREFRRIAGEVGGSDVLGQLDELIRVEYLSEEAPPAEVPKSNGRLETLEEEPSSPTHDWEMDPDHACLGDEDDEFDMEPFTPAKDSFAPPPIQGPPTPSQTIPQLADLRTFTTSLVTSLVTISEQAQVNGAATTEAGRKIRALKNKLGGWRTDWDNAERSRIKIEKWEAGVEGDAGDSADDCGRNGAPRLLARTSRRRIDGRKVVEEHLQAFDIALKEAAVRTKAIMAGS